MLPHPGIGQINKPSLVLLILAAFSVFVEVTRCLTGLTTAGGLSLAVDAEDSRRVRVALGGGTFPLSTPRVCLAAGSVLTSKASGFVYGDEALRPYGLVSRERLPLRDRPDDLATCGASR